MSGPAPEQVRRLWLYHQSQADDFRSAQLFDFKANWNLVLPHLRDRKLNAVLRRGINSYLESRRRECRAEGLTPGGMLLHNYRSLDGPWSYSIGDGWATRADELAEAAVDRGEFRWKCRGDEDPSEEEWERYDKFVAQFYPQPDTYQWYQAWGTCHWIAPWQARLGMRVFPERRWLVYNGDHHSFAAGEDKAGVKLIFDLLLFEEYSVQQIVEAALKGQQNDRN